MQSTCIGEISRSFLAPLGTRHALLPDEKVCLQVYIGKGYVNNPRVHDVVFVVEGKPFYAHKLALSASSETFRAMFDSGCLEGGTGIPEIQIPNLSRRVFEAMMMFVYTGEGGVTDHLDILPELLQARPP